MKFKVLQDFVSREFSGTNYILDGVYTIRQGNEKLLAMAERWLNAKLFIPKDDFDVMGMTFKAGIRSYVLPGDSLIAVIDDKVNNGLASYVGTGLITFNGIPDTAGGLSGDASKDSAMGAQ